MKTLFSLLAISLFTVVSATAQDVDKLPAITVTGTAEVQVAPNEATFTLAVVKLDKDLQLAKQQNDEAVAKVLDVTRRFAVKPQDVKTDYIAVEMKYDRVRDAQGRTYDASGNEVVNLVFRGYQVSKTVIVKLTDIAKFEEFFTEILKTGITEVKRVEFATSQLRPNQDKARELAMKAAREKADALAGAVGQTVGKAVRITEGVTYNPSYESANTTSNNYVLEGNFTGSTTTFAPGSVTVSARVSVSFLLN